MSRLTTILLCGTLLSCDSAPAPEDIQPPTLAEGVAVAQRQAEVAKWVEGAVPVINAWRSGQEYPTMPATNALHRRRVISQAADLSNLSLAFTDETVAVIAARDWSFQVGDPYSHEHQLVCDQGIVFDKTALSVTCLGTLKRMQ